MEIEILDLRIKFIGENALKLMANQVFNYTEELPSH